MSEKKVNALLIVEDDPALQKQMRWSLDKFEVSAASDRGAAIALVRKDSFAVVTMDLGLPPDPDSVSEGFKLLEEILAHAPNTKVIVLTGQNDHANALRAVACGAYDFFSKPFDPDLLVLTIDRAFKLFHLEQENTRLAAMRQSDVLGGLVSRDPEMLRITRIIEKVADSNATVLLLGESGTGKELLARALHQVSNRRGERFVAINCAAIPENLLESELFGYEKGAFTGAVKMTLGKIEMAHRGTLMLDEIGDLSMALQAKILRFVQERVIERVGGRQEIAVDVRIVAATHQDLSLAVSERRFREDLYYRLAEIVVKVPPLRDRVGDKILLAHAFIKRFSLEQKRGTLTFSEDALSAIDLHNWPGNVREMENLIKRVVIMTEGKRVTRIDLGLNGESIEDPIRFDLRRIREQAERQAVIAVMARVNDNIAKAAELLGVSRPTLYDLIHRFGLKQ